MKKLILLLIVALLCAMTSCSSDPGKVVSQSDESSQVEIDEEPETAEEETEEPTTEEETEAETDTSWKKAYIEFLNTLEKDNYDGYQLIYIDDDDIPELAISGKAHLIPGYICWISDGEVNYINMTLVSFKYFEKENRFLCNECFTGSGTDTIYELNGSEAKEVKSGKFSTIAENEYYNWDGTDYPTMDEYYDAVQEDFDSDSAQQVTDKLSYSEICKEIKDY